MMNPCPVRKCECGKFCMPPGHFYFFLRSWASLRWSGLLIPARNFLKCASVDWFVLYWLLVLDCQSIGVAWWKNLIRLSLFPGSAECLLAFLLKGENAWITIMELLILHCCCIRPLSPLFPRTYWFPNLSTVLRIQHLINSGLVPGMFRIPRSLKSVQVKYNS